MVFSPPQNIYFLQVIHWHLSKFLKYKKMYSERPSCFTVPLPGRNQPSLLLYVILEIFYALLSSLWSEIWPDRSCWGREGRRPRCLSRGRCTAARTGLGVSRVADRQVTRSHVNSQVTQKSVRCYSSEADT